MCVVPAELALLHFAKKLLQVTQKVPQWELRVDHLHHCYTSLCSFLTSHFLQLQLWCWADGTLRRAELGCENTMKATPKRHVPVYLSYMVGTGRISHYVVGERAENLSLIDIFKIYQCLFRWDSLIFNIFLFCELNHLLIWMCVSLSWIRNWGFACVRAHIN